MKNNKKLILKKEKITSLSVKSLDNVVGGKKANRTEKSSDHWITCCWCTGPHSLRVECIQD